MDADAGRSRVLVTEGKSFVGRAMAAAGLGVVADGIKAVKASVVAAMDPPKPQRKRAPVWAGYAPIGEQLHLHAGARTPTKITVVTHIEHGKAYPYASTRQNTRNAWRHERALNRALAQAWRAGARGTPIAPLDPGHSFPDMDGLSTLRDHGYRMDAHGAVS